MWLGWFVEFRLEKMADWLHCPVVSRDRKRGTRIEALTPEVNTGIETRIWE